MTQKIRLTPKDVLYISDVLNQFESYHAEISEDLVDVKNKQLKKSMKTISDEFQEQFCMFKDILKGASNS